MEIKKQRTEYLIFHKNKQRSVIFFICYIVMPKISWDLYTKVLVLDVYELLFQFLAYFGTPYTKHWPDGKFWAFTEGKFLATMPKTELWINERLPNHKPCRLQRSERDNGFSNFKNNNFGKDQLWRRKGYCVGM